MFVAVAFVATLAAAGSGSAAARSDSAQRAFRVRTLVSSRRRIWAFAQDGSRIAWISARRAGCAVHIRSLHGGPTSVTPTWELRCPRDYLTEGALALAGRSGVWAGGGSCGNNECFWDVIGARAGARRARHLGLADFPCEPAECGNRVLYPPPLLASGGQLLAYYAPDDINTSGRGELKRIEGGRMRPLFAPTGIIQGLAVSQGRIATASLLLHRGNGCGCLNVPVWSPDGSKIAYLDGYFFPNQEPDASLAVMNADGSGRHDISGGAQVSSLSWSPDATKIAYENLDGKIEVANADGSGSVELTPGRDPAWSPDGTKIAFVQYGDNSAGIFLMNPDGTGIHELATFGPSAPPLTLEGPAWSPDGTRIAFSFSNTLEVMNADGTDVHNVGGANSEGKPAWSPDGSQIAFQSGPGLSVIRADGSDLRPLTSGPDEEPSWSPDGKTIVFASHRDDIYAGSGISYEREYLELYLVDSDGSDLRPLSFTRPADGASEVTVHSAAGRLLSKLDVYGYQVPCGIALAGSLAAVCTSNAQASRTGPRGDRITILDARTGAQVAAVPIGSGSIVAGADEHWVVFSHGPLIAALNLRTRRVLDLARAAKLVALRGIYSPLDLTVSGRRVAWVENLHGHARIRSLELQN